MSGLQEEERTHAIYSSHHSETALNLSEELTERQNVKANQDIDITHLNFMAKALNSGIAHSEERDRDLRGIYSVAEVEGGRVANRSVRPRCRTSLSEGAVYSVSALRILDPI